MIITSEEAMRRDLEFQQKTKKKIEHQLKKYERWDGYYLSVRTSKGRLYYYLTSTDKTKNKKEKRKYIGDATRPAVKALQERHYLERALKNCTGNIKALEDALEKYKSIDPETVVAESGKAYSSNPDVGQSLFKNSSASKWRREGLAERERLERYRPYPDRLVLRSASGEMMRTRGEIIVGNTLDELGLTYVYEWPKQIAGKLRWPDFTVLHPKTHEVITIEYMGMYSDAEYRENNNPRLDEFFSEGYVLGQNLWAFMDNEEGIIDSNKIRRVLRALFCE
ncbi:MAG: hypothetical protein KBS56_03995 [Clostridiales bacterium]|nr:hypothetical protein [Candidatus Crickella equi]